MTKENGGPAFPVKLESIEDNAVVYNCYRGMSVRDYMAAKAMNAFIIGTAGRGELQDADFFSVIAKHSYKFADAMIAERDK